MTLSLDQLVTLGRAHAEKTLIGKNDVQLLPTFHIQFKNRPPAILAVPWRTDEEKADAILAIKLALREFGPDVENYSFMSEAWVATQDHEPRPGDLAPADREDRRECVFVTAGDRDRVVTRSFEIERDASARVTALKALDDGPLCASSGRLFNLMADDDDD